MGFIGGYQSNFNFNALQLVGDFPIDHLLGGYGVASGTDAYVLTLNPAIGGYRAGLPLEVKFTHPNTGPATINVDGKGPQTIKKITNGVLTDLAEGDLAIYKIYILIHDGTYFQVANLYESGSLMFPENATEDIRGIAEIASTAEINAGVDNSKIVTPAKLAAYVANKLTGLWEDKGLINCSTNPLYPAGQVGDAYTVSAAGKIGGPAGTNVSVRSIIYCNQDNPGGTQAAVGNSWTVIQSTIEMATEAIAGIARIALQAEVNEGTNNSIIVTPLRLKTLLDNLLASEAVRGLAEIATQLEVNAGTDDTRIVTPLKLSTLLNSLLRYTAGSVASAIMPKTGEGNSASAAFAAILNGENNIASGPYSAALGRLAKADLFGQFAKASGGFFNVAGSAQSSMINLFHAIPDRAPTTALTLDGGEPSVNNRWAIELRAIQHFTAMVSVVENSGSTGQAGDSWTGIFEGAVKNTNGTLKWIGGDPVLRNTRQDPGFFPTIQFTQTGDYILITVDGMNGRNLHAMATVYITQTKFSLE